MHTTPCYKCEITKLALITPDIPKDELCYMYGCVFAEPRMSALSYEDCLAMEELDG